MTSEMLLQAVLQEPHRFGPHKGAHAFSHVSCGKDAGGFDKRCIRCQAEEVVDARATEVLATDKPDVPLVSIYYRGFFLTWNPFAEVNAWLITRNGQVFATARSASQAHELVDAIAKRKPAGA